MTQDSFQRDIIYSSSDTGDEDLYIMSAEGKEIRRLTNFKKNGVTNRTPEWSPCGKFAAFQSNINGGRDLYLINVESGEINRVTDFGNCNHPAFSADGQSLAFTANCGNGMELYTVHIDGKGVKSIMPKEFSGRNAFNPCWIPETEKICFVLQGLESQPDSLWQISSDGSNANQFGPSDLSIFEFDWSKENGKIVFDAKVSNNSVLGDWDIFIMDSDGSGVSRLTDTQSMNSRPKWLSNGETIVFHTNRFSDFIVQPGQDASLDTWFEYWNQFEICTMDKNGQNIRRLTENKLRDVHPDG